MPSDEPLLVDDFGPELTAMNIRCLPFLFLLFAAFTAQAQHRCEHAEQTQRMHDEHPEWNAAQAMRAQFLSNFTQAFSMEALDDLPSELVIPVVFHVVHDGGEENISDAQIHEAVVQLNEDFSATNPELADVHASFVDLVADVGMSFRLADFAPNGDPTTGINRLQSHHTYNGSNIGLKELIQWDPTRYLNIWVVHSSDGGEWIGLCFLSHGRGGERFDLRRDCGFVLGGRADGNRGLDPLQDPHARGGALGEFEAHLGRPNRAPIRRSVPP